MTLLDKLLYLGCEKLSDQADEKYIVLTNGFLLVFLLFPISYAPYLFFYSIPKLIVLVIALKALGYLMSYPLNYFGWHTASKINFGLVYIIGTTTLLILIGNRVSGQLILLPAIFVPFGIYSPKEKYALYAHVILLTSALVAFEFGIIGNNPLAMDQKLINILIYHNFLFMVIFITVTGIYVRFTLRKAEARLDSEINKSNNLLLNILPEPIAAKLKETHQSLADHYDHATILFADIVGFTTRSAAMDPNALVGMLDEIFTEFDTIADKHGVEKIKTIGDAYMAVGGVPVPTSDHCAAIVETALDMRDVIHNRFSHKYNKLDVRIGIHSGPVVAGVIGRKKFSYDLWGDSVNTAARMESHGLPGKIQVSQTVYELLKNKYFFEKRGEIEIKGKGMMETYFLEGKRNIAEGCDSNRHRMMNKATTKEAAPIT